MRNPKWTREELILALDFYREHFHDRNSSSLPEGHSRIKEISDLLRKRGAVLGGEMNETYRSPGSVRMKVMNFLSLDPGYSGEGLNAASKLDRQVFGEFEVKPDSALRSAAEKIKNEIEKGESVSATDEESDITEETLEGRVIFGIHRSLERKPGIVRRKKRQVQKVKGRLQCECCGFDFEEAYGERGEGFIECHHKKPISGIKSGEKTTLEDLSLVCSNCHRMIHRSRPWLTIDQVRKLLKRS